MNQYQIEVITKTQEHVKNLLGGDSTGHDWWHVYRVYKTACYIAKIESADLFIVALAALLHDIADWKFNDGDLTAGSISARQWLDSLKVAPDITKKVCDIIQSVSFKGAGAKIETLSLEGKVVQDADRLDAIGAIGIGRTFAYGGYKNRPMHDPDMAPFYHNNFNEYKNHKGSTINHFHEKLLLLKDRMGTDTGKRLAAEKHKYMETFLKQFMQEWSAEYDLPTKEYV